MVKDRIRLEGRVRGYGGWSNRGHRSTLTNEGVLKEYGIAPRQLVGLSWTLVAYFIDRCIREEPPMFDVFQYFYQLKFIIQGASVGMVHFSARMGREPIIKNWASNIHLNHARYLGEEEAEGSSNFSSSYSSSKHEMDIDEMVDNLQVSEGAATLKTESAIPTDLPIPTTAPLLTEPSFGTTHSFPRASLLNFLQLTSPNDEVNTFFPWRDCIRVGQYHFSPYKEQRLADLEAEKKAIKEQHLADLEQRLWRTSRQTQRLL
ncbi:hypothetical protein PVK06_020353 [Gossypium arboreum]|uniref:Uncharacterized protein n=1 Tax=Gossypium arboreum TaxID=29729 RepID=A0ABR0PM58_GOSAR|nr:hypothetical protein PVK06_020353 [Gossypium arboreum]